MVRASSCFSVIRDLGDAPGKRSAAFSPKQMIARAPRNDAKRFARFDVPDVPPPPNGEPVLPVLFPNMVLPVLLLEPNMLPPLFALEPKPIVAAN